MLVSNTLSRSHLNHSEPEFPGNSLIHHVHFVLSNLPISETCLKQFQSETKNDPIWQTLNTYTTHKWPQKHLMPTDLHPYYTQRSVITFCQGILMKNELIIVLHYHLSRNKNSQPNEAIINHPISKNCCRSFLLIWTLFTNDRLLLFHIYCYWDAQKFTNVDCYK